MKTKDVIKESAERTNKQFSNVFKWLGQKKTKEWEQFLKDMGWDKPYTFTLEKQRVKSLLDKQKKEIFLNLLEKTDELYMPIGRNELENKIKSWIEEIWKI